MITNKIKAGEFGNSRFYPANQPFLSAWQEQSSFGLKSAHLGGKAGQFPEGQTRDKKENTEIRVPFVRARRKGVCGQTGSALGSSEEAKHPPEALPVLCRGWWKLSYNQPEWQQDQQTSFQRRTRCPVPQTPGTSHTQRRGRKVALPNSSHPRGTAQPESGSWRLPLWAPLLTTVDWLPKRRKKLGMGMTENRVGRTPGIWSQTPNYILLISFFDQKFQNRENHKVQKLFWCFSLSQNTPPVMCAKRKWGAEGVEAKMGKAGWSFHFFSFFLSFSFMARIIMSFLKRVMKSKKRSTQCQI